MSVKLIDSYDYYGFRVRRSIRGKNYQEYFSLKEDGQRFSHSQKLRVERLAIKRDLELKFLQDVAKKMHKANDCFRVDGSVKGICLINRYSRKGTEMKVFAIGIQSDLTGKLFLTDCNIRKHGVNGAWGIVINAYCKHKEISNKSKLYKKLIAAVNNYDLQGCNHSDQIHRAATPS